MHKRGFSSFLQRHIALHIALKWDGYRFGTLPTPQRETKEMCHNWFIVPMGLGCL